MVNRIEIVTLKEDARALTKQKFLIAMGFVHINDVEVVDVYTIEKTLNRKQILSVAQLLTNPLTQTAFVNSAYLPKKFNWAIEIGFLPGVTDNVASTAKEEIGDLLKLTFEKDEGVYTSQLLFLAGKLTRVEIDSVGKGLFNPLIQRVDVKSKKMYVSESGMNKVVPRVSLKNVPSVSWVDLEVNDQELVELGKKGIANIDGSRRGPLALDLTYMKAIQKYFRDLGRNPTDMEIESIAQTWSEHCKHTIFSDPIDDIKEGLFKRYIKGATDKIRKLKGENDNCVSVFTDNAGAVEFDKDYLICDKVETHNSPSALDPFGGAITGIVGVNRDVIGFGLGAKPVANRYGYCFGFPNDERRLYRDEAKAEQMLSPRRILDGVVEGVNSGGNQSGIPTPQGFLFFDNGYRGKPLVFVGTLGLIPKKIGSRLGHQKKARAGDWVVMIGGRVGLDGIHGATFSSEALDTGSPSTAVQIGDPITQKKLSDALIGEVRDKDLYNSITDNGAGGLSCSVAEMAKESGGCEVWLDKVPIKYPGLDPWQIWISESQERMTLAVSPNKWKRFQKIMDKHGVEATVIGIFTKNNKCVVKYYEQVVMNVEMDFLHDGLPKRPMKTKRLKREKRKLKHAKIKDWDQVILNLLAYPNIASFEFISSQYDHEVQGTSVLKPLQGRGLVNAEATAIRPVLDSQKAVVISQGLYPSYSNFDPYWMAACSIDTAIRNIVAAGGDLDNTVLLDNFCWCSSDDPKRLWQLKQAAKACYDFSVAYTTPFVSGKDSMFNDFKGFDEKGQFVKISVPPTLLISSFSVVENASELISMDVKFVGDLVYVLGNTNQELGGSEYLRLINSGGGEVPKVDAKLNIKVYEALRKCIQMNLISSSMSVVRGGLAVALSKTAMAGKLGVDVDLSQISGTTAETAGVLFSESQGRLIVTISPDKQKKFENVLTGLPYSWIGTVTGDNKITVKVGNNNIVFTVDRATEAYKSTFKDY